MEMEKMVNRKNSVISVVIGDSFIDFHYSKPQISHGR